jgi:hypothetical protein
MNRLYSMTRCILFYLLEILIQIPLALFSLYDAIIYHTGS